jgi:hypothetical protein
VGRGLDTLEFHCSEGLGNPQIQVVSFLNTGGGTAGAIHLPRLVLVIGANSPRSGCSLGTGRLRCDCQPRDPFDSLADSPSAKLDDLGGEERAPAFIPSSERPQIENCAGQMTLRVRIPPNSPLSDLSNVTPQI